MRKFTLALLIVGVFVAAMLFMSMAQNGGCLPWQERVGVDNSAFSGTEDVTRCG